MHPIIKPFVLILLAALAAGSIAGEDGEERSGQVQRAQVTLEGAQIVISAAGDRFQLSGPNGFFVVSEQPYFDFGGDIPDGIYTFTVYQNVGRQGVVVSAAENEGNGRGASMTPGQVSRLVTSGNFQITDNKISTVK